jgi:hypothetical protein
MKTRLLLAVASLFCTQIAQAEIRTFTNSAGKSIKAELVAMEGEAAVLKLGNGRTAKVPLKSLSEEDQTFIKTWWEKNKQPPFPRPPDRPTAVSGASRQKQIPSNNRQIPSNNCVYPNLAFILNTHKTSL